MTTAGTRIAIAFLFLLAFSATSAVAQENSTLGGFKPSQNIKNQKSPNRKMASRIAEQEDAKSSILSGKTDQNKTLDKKPIDKKPLPLVSDKRRGELMKFVDAHHKELRPLINQLRKQRPGQYQIVLRTLDRNVKNIQSLEKKSPARYQRSLDQWILSSRIQLLSAQLAVKKTDKEKAKLRAQIRPLIKTQLELRLTQLEIDTEQAKKRYDRLQAQVNELAPNRDQLIQRRMEEIDKTSQRISAQNKKAKDKKKAEALRKKSEQTNKVKNKTDNKK